VPLPRETFSEIGRHAEVVTVRLYHFDTTDTIESRAKAPGLRGEQWRRSSDVPLAVVSDDTVFSGSDDCRIKVWGCALVE
jgi:hypothetical protein